MTLFAIGTGSPPASAERDGYTQCSVGGHSLSITGGAGRKKYTPAALLMAECVGIMDGMLCAR